ncbi:MAG TPA: pantoate--beta-alanine ligase [Pseudomonadales bacterium]|nr:pantoate--beta-alanine ligase [Pseudomonadales bacterium]
MQTLHAIAPLREAVLGARRAGERIAFVPTMGNLHEGHLQLVDEARRRAQRVVASIFVNPLQFGPTEDLDAYPRTLDADREALAAHGVDWLFAPTVAEMYPDGAALQTRVTVPELADELCGASRPGHFEGVATVVTKLLNIVTPDVALFGCKDYQQLTVIRRMIRDLSMAVEVVGVPTVRAADGLALSSRNGYLSAEERERAPALYATLEDIAARIRAGERDYPALEAHGRERLAAGGLHPDYVSVRRREDLHRPTPADLALVVLAAARLGSTRLIDNLEVTIEP